MSNPVAIIMVGFPASGKSTYVKSLPETWRKLDFDSWLNKWAEMDGITYSQAFQRYAKDAQKEFNTSITDSLSAGESFIVDKTNLTRKGRTKLCRRIRSSNRDYLIRCVWMSTELDECMKRSKLRESSTNGKVIREQVFTTMNHSFDYPTIDEGFDEILEKSTCQT